MNTPFFSCEKAKKLDLVDFLESLGFVPEKIRNNDYWYKSPLRQEEEASFKVNRSLNLWFDHGTGKGGNVVDFGILYFGCSVSELLQKLNGNSHQFSFHQHNKTKPILNTENEKGKITILHSGTIVSLPLKRYLKTRAIPLELANRYCREVTFELYGKKDTAIGFQNNSGGYELRSSHFKGSSSPKDITIIDQHSTDVSVFEGFFNFLSFQAIRENSRHVHGNFLVLNSLAFFEKSRPVLESHQAINLYLDRDQAGIEATRKAVALSPKLYRDCSGLYDGFKDLNERLIQSVKSQSQHLKMGRRF